MKPSIKSNQLLGIMICVSTLITSSIPLNKSSLTSPPNPPLLPSQNPDDYISGFYYMFSTGDFTLLDKMIGSEGTQYHFPYGVGFSPLGKDNAEEVKSEFQKASGIYNAQCLGVDITTQGKFTIFFKGIHFKEFEEDTINYFLFMKDENNDWGLFVFGNTPDYITESYLSSFDACPLNPYKIPDEQKSSKEQDSTSAEAPSAIGFTDLPPDNEDQIEKKKSRSFFSRFIKQAYAADICTPRRNEIDDNNNAFVQCVEYVQQIRPDALCWLDYEAYAYKWDEYAINYGADIVSVSSTPMVGDIAVWNRECGGEYSTNGHVAIVTNVTENSDGQTFIDVDEANVNFTGKIGSRTDIPVHVCMKFIHEPGINTYNGESSDRVINEVPRSKKDSWWQSFLCFINPWCD